MGLTNEASDWFTPSEAAKEVRQLITEATERVAEAVQAAARVGALLQAIDQAAREQQQGVGQVNEAVGHLNGVTQQNAAMIELLAAAAQ